MSQRFDQPLTFSVLPLIPEIMRKLISVMLFICGRRMSYI